MHDAHSAAPCPNHDATQPAVPATAPRQLLWRAQKNGALPLFFFGALHFGTPEMYPLPQIVEDAFRDCGVTAFETDLGTIASPAFHALMAKAGTMPEGHSLAGQLSADTWQGLCQRAQSLGYHDSTISRLRSWYCASLLTSSALQLSGMASQLGVDSYLFARAKAQDKIILCLEQPDEQLQLLSSINSASDDEFIQNTLAEIDNMPAFTQHMLQIWLRGDAAELAALISSGFEGNNALQKRMLQTRNRSWFQQLHAANHEGKAVLSVVGAGHLVGDNSLLEFFRHHGYDVAQL
ncbi:MAG TPA: TraB/GumN family protein [Lentisphaeria bacterium]|nr:TraB/GumN family protein [Lentisphaeria bacterium]